MKEDKQLNFFREIEEQAKAKQQMKEQEKRQQKIKTKIIERRMNNE